MTINEAEEAINMSGQVLNNNRLSKLIKLVLKEIE